ncbi:putative fad oxidoreductase [Hibiscus syriacus]|uniref:Fad oxidoreductase n=1 Tax=Hibiscus syriacus TaxID=106335 RepID=A0A6A3D2P5_HIBSY|nr:putative fad oxidoreductase [Hibiscus syriacus]
MDNPKIHVTRNPVVACGGGVIGVCTAYFLAKKGASVTLVEQSSGYFVATGHSCWGILNGPATGAAVAELVVEGRASIVDLSLFRPARFVDA